MIHILFKNPAYRKLLLFTLIALAVLVYFGILRDFLPVLHGEAIPADYLDNNLFISLRVPPDRWYASLWDETALVKWFVCLFLSFICLVLGTIRAAKKLDSLQIFLIALFSAFFSLMELSLTAFAAARISHLVLFYSFWLSFFLWPIPMSLHFFSYLRGSLKHYLWAATLLLGGYSIVSLGLHLVFAMPFDFAERMYTLLSVTIAASAVMLAFLPGKEKPAAAYLKGIAVYWLLWCGFFTIKAVTWGYPSFHNEFSQALFISLVLMMCYLIYTSTQEIAEFRSAMQLQSLQSSYLLENYQMLDNHFIQIAKMKHEIRHHLFTMRSYFRAGEYIKLESYLDSALDDFSEIEEPILCDNRIIQSVLGHFAKRAAALGVAVDFDIAATLPALPPGDSDLVSLLMNLMDNAVEAQTAIGCPDKRHIQVQLKLRQGHFYFSVTNARKGSIMPKGAIYASTKSSPLLHGYGLIAICNIVEKHNGHTMFSHTADSFTAEIVLPLE